MLGTFIQETARNPKLPSILNYELLKQEVLGKDGGFLWKDYIIYPGSTLCLSMTQLLSLLMEAEIDPDKAKEMYTKLKSSPHYDPFIGLFNSGIGFSNGEQDPGVVLNSIYNTHDQLLDVVVISQIYGINSARAKYAELIRRSDMYANGMWTGFLINKERYESFQMRDVEISTMLLSILVLQLFDEKSALSAYKRLQQTSEYKDKNRGENSMVDCYFASYRRNSSSYIDLLDFLVKFNLVSIKDALKSYKSNKIEGSYKQGGGLPAHILGLYSNLMYEKYKEGLLRCYSREDISKMSSVTDPYK